MRNFCLRHYGILNSAKTKVHKALDLLKKNNTSFQSQNGSCKQFDLQVSKSKGELHIRTVNRYCSSPRGALTGTSGQTYWARGLDLNGHKRIKAERCRIDAFELWCWRRLLRVPWTARRSNQSILKEISPGISLEGMILKLKLQYSGHLMQRVDSLEKTLMLGGIGGRRRRGWQRMRWLDGITDSMDVSLSEVQELVINRVAWHTAIHGVAKSWAWLSNWTELNWTDLNYTLD